MFSKLQFVAKIKDDRLFCWSLNSLQQQKTNENHEDFCESTETLKIGEKTCRYLKLFLLSFCGCDCVSGADYIIDNLSDC